MDLENIKRGLRAEIKKRENEQYATFQCNVRQMCKDVLAKLEEQESEIAELEESHKKEVEQLLIEIVKLKKKLVEQATLRVWAELQLRHNKYKRCLAMAEWCNSEMVVETFACFRPRRTKEVWREENKYWAKWRKIWFELAMKFKEAK